MTLRIQLTTPSLESVKLKNGEEIPTFTDFTNTRWYWDDPEPENPPGQVKTVLIPLKEHVLRTVLVLFKGEHVLKQVLVPLKGEHVLKTVLIPLKGEHVLKTVLIPFKREHVLKTVLIPFKGE